MARPVKPLIDPRILPQARAMFARLVQIIDNNNDDTWESLGGHRREYLDIGDELQQLLGLGIFDVPPHYTIGDAMPDDELDPESWRHAQALRRELE